MPGGDGTGPRGIGPMTGGGRGYCVMPAENSRQSVAPRFYGRGGGRGRRNWYRATGMPGRMRASYVPELTPNEEMGTLKDEAQILKQQLDEVQGRIDTLEKDQK